MGGDECTRRRCNVSATESKQKAESKTVPPCYAWEANVTVPCTPLADQGLRLTDSPSCGLALAPPHRLLGGVKEDPSKAVNVGECKPMATHLCALPAWIVTSLREGTVLKSSPDHSPSPGSPVSLAQSSALTSLALRTCAQTPRRCSQDGLD